ncbi:unnamed protein product [Symbiodinium sp. CCMP2456]|nr:unnamed protein product [Symbiodinium sp. CCMP2456]
MLHRGARRVRSNLYQTHRGISCGRSPSAIRANSSKVHVAVDGDKSYRTADELIEAASLDNEQKAPASVTKNSVIGGTVKIREFSSEEIPADGQWPLLVKVKRRHKGDNTDDAKFKQLEQLCEELRERLFQEVQKTLFVWLEEYRDYWAPGSLQSES